MTNDRANKINAPSSIKNAEKKCDPEMHQTQKGNEWKFGMKCNVGVDAGSGLVHSITATSANVHDINEAHKLIREDDEVVYGDSGYTGIEKRGEIKNIDWERYIDYRKSAVRCKVEHSFKIIKDTFGFRKVRYRGIAKKIWWKIDAFGIEFCCFEIYV